MMKILIDRGRLGHQPLQAFHVIHLSTRGRIVLLVVLTALPALALTLLVKGEPQAASAANPFHRTP